jgi:hypothetical protein
VTRGRGASASAKVRSTALAVRERKGSVTLSEALVPRRFNSAQPDHCATGHARERHPGVA